MTKIEALRAGKWNHQMATAEEVKAKVEEIREQVEKYGWGDRMIHPYGFGVRIDEFLGWFEDYDRCTASSKHLHLSEINGFLPIINTWIEEAEAPKVKVRLLTGNKAGEVKEISSLIAEDYIECGLAELA